MGSDAVVCTLDAGGHEGRLEEFRHFFRLAYIGGERTEKGFTWRFKAMPGLDEQLRSLAVREQDCCAFLDFSVQQHAEEVVWNASGPAKSRAVLDQFFTLPETLDMPSSDIKKKHEAAGLTFSADRKATRSSAILVGLGVLSCAACCAIPLFAALGVSSVVLGAIGTYADSIAVTMVALGIGLFAFSRWRRHAKKQLASPACAIDCSCKAGTKAQGC